MTLKYSIIPVTAFQQNCTVLWCDKTRKAAVVDPGGDVDRIASGLQKLGLTPEKVLLTHGHIDHAGGAAEFAERFGVPVVGPHQEDAFWLEGLARQAAMFGVPKVRTVTPDLWLKHGDVVTVGEESLTVYHTPGHTPGHVVFHHVPTGLALVGDVLFAGSIGRTDFPKGDYDALIRSIREQLWPLGDDTTFIPGHGPLSTFGEERRSNPFVGDGA